MNFLETTISRKISEADPTLDLLGSDRKLLQIANQDFANYMKFIRLSGKETANGYTAEKTEPSMKEKAELESFLTVWVSIWLKKWKNRVKLVFGNQSQESADKTQTFSKTEHLMEKMERKHEIIEILVSALIKNAEICGTEILAEHLLRTELGKKNSEDDINNKGQVLAILNDSLRKAREIAHNEGPLIFVRIDKGYYTQQTPKEIPRQ
ncbi:MAG TPA: hypothetical protein VF893_05485 [Candidatus Bathyarchaeia archaeon]